jgi:DNA-binding HxlR family transcriptional regulator
MEKPRRYKLLCPIARALDRVGDRWTLLILRDLHAGPARFSDLKTGLDGIATNLLTDRLRQLIDDGLVVRREGEFGTALYTLTELGRRSRDLLFELALFGGRFPPDEDLRSPGNLRTVAVMLEAACQRVVTPEMDFVTSLEVDGEVFTLTVRDGRVDVRYAAVDDPDVTIMTEYEPMVAAGDGRLPLGEFTANHLHITAHTPDKVADMLTLLGAAMTQIVDAD